MMKIAVSLAVAVIVVLGAWIGWAYYGQSLAYTVLGNIFVPAQAGAWGDSFGAFNALFGALGFTAVLGTLLIQGRAIREQQRDQHRQRFESTFFQLLHMIREARKEVRFVHSKHFVSVEPRANRSVKTGHAAFRSAHKEMDYWLKRGMLNNTKFDRSAMADIYARRIHNRYESTFGAYYRLIYGILDRVRMDDHLSEDQKDSFGNLVRGQFTSFEALLAGCNGLSDFAKDFDTIITRFRLLKYARRGDIYDQLRRHYPRDAFLGRDEAEEEPIVDELDDDEEDNGSGG